MKGTRGAGFESRGDYFVVKFAGHAQNFQEQNSAALSFFAPLFAGCTFWLDGQLGYGDLKDLIGRHGGRVVSHRSLLPKQHAYIVADELTASLREELGASDLRAVVLPSFVTATVAKGVLQSAVDHCTIQRTSHSLEQFFSAAGSSSSSSSSSASAVGAAAAAAAAAKPSALLPAPEPEKQQSSLSGFCRKRGRGEEAEEGGEGAAAASASAAAAAPADDDEDVVILQDSGSVGGGRRQRQRAPKHHPSPQRDISSFFIAPAAAPAGCEGVSKSAQMALLRAGNANMAAQHSESLVVVVDDEEEEMEGGRSSAAGAAAAASLKARPAPAAAAAPPPPLPALHPPLALSLNLQGWLAEAGASDEASTPSETQALTLCEVARCAGESGERVALLLRALDRLLPAAGGWRECFAQRIAPAGCAAFQEWTGAELQWRRRW